MPLAASRGGVPLSLLLARRPPTSECGAQHRRSAAARATAAAAAVMASGGDQREPTERDRHNWNLGGGVESFMEVTAALI